MTNAFPYILLTTIYGVLAILHKYYRAFPNRTLFINVLAIFIFSIFFGLRGFVAYDWTSYYALYTFRIPELIGLFNTPFSKWPTEPGFTLLASACKTLINNYIVFQFTCTCLNLALLTHFFKRYTDNLSICFVIFITMGGIVFSIDLMRNSLAIFIFLNAIPFIEKKKICSYMLVCLIAVSFHTSALAYIPMYFILNRNYNKYLLIGIFVAANIICILHIPILKSIVILLAGIIDKKSAQYIDGYMNYNSTNTFAFGIGYIERLFTGILVLAYKEQLQTLRKSNILTNSIFLYLFINLFLSEFRTISMRCSNLFIYSYWIIWQDLTKCIYYKANKILYILLIGSYCLLKSYLANCGNMSQYYNILFNYKAHSERVLYFNKHMNDK